MISSSATLNVAAAHRGYIEKMTTEVQGLKVLLLDADTSAMVSMVYTQSEIIGNEVYLIESIDKVEDRQEMPHLKCVTYLRPTEDNVAAVCRELRRPNYGEYHLYFTNILTRDQIRLMAEADEKEVVKHVEEYYGDTYAVNSDTFAVMSAPTAVGERVTQGLAATLLAMKRRPTCIRFQKNSAACQSLASSVFRTMSSEAELFHFSHGSCTLLVVDRLEDPVTPLLLPWTYQAMLHEYLELNRNKVVLDKTDMGKLKKIEENEYMFAPALDAFYSKHMYCNWGELCTSVKELVETFQKTCNMKEELRGGSIADLKAMMQQLPEARRLGSTVAKHVATVGEMGDALRKRGLFNVGVLEQDIAVNNSHSDHWRQLVDLISNMGSRQVEPADVLRVAMLYVLRYEKNPNCNVSRLKDLLSQNGMSADLVERVSALRDRCGADKRQGTSLLFPNESNLFKVVMSAVKGMDQETSVYTQHEPLLKKLVTMAAKGTLPGDMYPTLPGTTGSTTDKPREVIVFIVGGATYSEAAVVHQLNNPTPGDKTAVTDVKVVLGSTTLLNSQQFVNML
eukprot:PhM_4_TR9113/c0_g1_i1/m.30757/K12479/VPS45; vacuolar protein sorting-associated protein 45